MTTPLWVLLGFAVWTLLVLLAGIGVRRWTLILGGRAQLTDFPADTVHGTTAYRRAMRAHANCVENLPVFGAIAFVAFAAQVNSALMDGLAVAVLVARVCQSLVHMSLAESNVTVLVRFIFFAVQLIAMLWMAAEVAFAASASLPSGL
jgi:uncharacterized MAPEG superfamily protein